MADDGAAGQLNPSAGEKRLALEQKRAASRAAAELIEDGMRVGLGTGTTVEQLLPVVAQLGRRDLRCVATSPATESQALALGLPLETLDLLGELDIAIDGADQVDPAGWLIKGGGAAHTREKIVAAAAARFVVIVSADKVVDALRAPVPLELIPFGVEHTLHAIAPARLRGLTRSPDGGLIGDYLGPIEDARALAARLSAAPGVVEHGLFPPEMVSEVLIGEADGVRRMSGGKRTSG